MQHEIDFKSTLVLTFYFTPILLLQRKKPGAHAILCSSLLLLNNNYKSMNAKFMLILYISHLKTILSIYCILQLKFSNRIIETEVLF